MATMTNLTRLTTKEAASQAINQLITSNESEVLAQWWAQSSTSAVMRRTIHCAVQGQQADFFSHHVGLSVVEQLKVHACDAKAVAQYLNLVVSCAFEVPRLESAIFGQIPHVLKALADSVEVIAVSGDDQIISRNATDIRGVLTTLALILQRGTTGHSGILDSIPRLQLVALAHNITLLVASEIVSLETRQTGAIAAAMLFALSHSPLEYGTHVQAIVGSLGLPADDFNTIAIEVFVNHPISQWLYFRGVLCSKYALTKLVSVSVEVPSHTRTADIDSTQHIILNVVSRQIIPKLLQVIAISGQSDEIQLAQLQCIDAALASLAKLDVTVLQSAGPELSLHFTDIFDCAHNRASHSFDKIRSLVGSIFEDLLALTRLIGDDTASAFLPSIVDALRRTDVLVKARYQFLRLVIVKFHSSAVERYWATALEDMFSALCMPAISGVVRQVLEVIARDSLSPSTCDDQWTLRWLPALMGLLFDANEHSSIKLVLEDLFKICPRVYTLLLAHVFDPSVLTLSKGHAGILVVITAGKRMKLDQDPTTVSFINQFVKQSVDSIFPEVRLGVLAYLCECSKTTQPFLPFELDLLLLTIRKNLTLDDGNDLDRFFGYVERILVRVNAAVTKQLATKDFASSLHSSPDVQFLRALFSLLQQQLHPTACYARRLCSLKIMTSMDRFRQGQQLRSFRDLFAFSSHYILSLVHGLGDAYEDVRVLSAALLRSSSSHILPFNDSFVGVLNSISDRLVSSNRPVDVDMLCQLYALNGSYSTSSTDSSRSHIQDLFDRILHLLDDQVGRISQSIDNIGLNAPTYGLLQSALVLLSSFSREIKSASETSKWLSSVNRLLIHCNTVVQLVSPVVMSAAPEGFSTTTQDGQNNDDGDDIDECGANDDSLSQTAHAYVKSQAILVCSWRSMKVVASLFTALCQQRLQILSAIATAADAPLIISQIDQVIDVGRIGEQLLDMMLSARHRGAVELIYEGYYEFCKLALVSHTSLYNQHLELIQARVASKDEDGTITRRSAGIPSALKAVLLASVSSKRSGIFSMVMSKLLTLIGWEHVENDCGDALDQLLHSQPRIHALNIIRAFARDSSLGSMLLAFVEPLLKIAVFGFLSSSFAVRNSSMMVFTVVMLKVFGVKKQKDEHSHSNTLSSFIFFNSYPTLLDFILERVALVSRSSNSSIQFESHIYPVLLLLSRLHAPLGDNPFITKLEQLNTLLDGPLSSPIAKAREVAAKAKVSLVLAPSPQILTRIVHALAGTSQNGLHGELLYILAHVKAAPIKNLSSLFMSMWELQDSARFVWASFVPRTIWLEVLDYMLSTPNCVEIEADFAINAIIKLKHLLSVSRLAPRCQPGRAQYRSHLASLAWRFQRFVAVESSTLLQELLFDSDYEVQTIALKNITNSPYVSLLGMLRHFVTSWQHTFLQCGTCPVVQLDWVQGIEHFQHSLTEEDGQSLLRLLVLVIRNSHSDDLSSKAITVSACILAKLLTQQSSLHDLDEWLNVVTKGFDGSDALVLSACRAMLSTAPTLLSKATVLSPTLVCRCWLGLLEAFCCGETTTRGVVVDIVQAYDSTDTSADCSKCKAATSSVVSRLTKLFLHSSDISMSSSALLEWLMPPCRIEPISHQQPFGHVDEQDAIDLSDVIDDIVNQFACCATHTHTNSTHVSMIEETILAKLTPLVGLMQRKDSSLQFDSSLADQFARPDVHQTLHVSLLLVQALRRFGCQLRADLDLILYDVNRFVNYFSHWTALCVVETEHTDRHDQSLLPIHALAITTDSN